MLKINTQVLVTLRYRFDEQISEADILAWLYNFEESDWGTALTLLNQVSFYSETRCANVLEDGLQQIIRAHSGMPIAIYPIGGIGKSGVVMAYHIKKIIGRFNHISWSFVDNNFSYSDTPYLVVLLDDFLGSGGSACKLLEQITPNIPQGSVVACLCVAYMQKAGTLLSMRNVAVYGDVHQPAFVRRHSVFGYPPRMKVVRDFALKYGACLYPKKQYVKGMDLYIGPLGYANSQSLVCFDHTTPNNTLPILWASKRRSDNGKKWVPLFPRRLFDRTRRDESYERLKYKWISIAQKISQGHINRLFNDFGRESIQLIGLLHGKYHKRSDSYICLLLETTHKQYEQLCENAVQRNLLREDGLLTDEGRRTYTSIRKKEFEARSLVIDMIIKKEYVYIPYKFLGISRD